MLGEEQSLFRENVRAMVNRKGGLIGATPIVTRGDVEFAIHVLPFLDRLPEVDIDPVQNERGEIPYMPGWDGPIGG